MMLFILLQITYFCICNKISIMYEYIKGTIVSLTPAEVVLENNGIGYIAQISLNTYSKLQNETQATVYIYYMIREDSHQFYGFHDRDERSIFLMLISVSGIGPNTARMMLSSMSPEEIRTAILCNDVNKIKSIKGIGLKTAQRLVIELKDKIGKGGETAYSAADISGITAEKEEALSALVMLGFAKAAAEKTLDSIIKENASLSIEDLIKAALKRL